MEALNGTQLGGRSIIVRFHEPKLQASFRAQAPPTARPFQGPATDYAAEARRERDNAQKKAAEEAAQREAKEKEERKTREEAEKKRKEAEWSRREEEKREAARDALRDKLRQTNARQERERVEGLLNQGWLDWGNAIAGMQDAKDRVDETAQAHADFKERCTEADEVVFEAERALQAAKARRVELAEASAAALLRKNAAENTYRDARLRVQETEDENERLRKWYEETVRNEEEEIIRNEEEDLRRAKAAEEEAEAKAEERRLAELAESIRKMKEIREQEVEEAARQERLEREEREAEERRKEADRLAHEERLEKEREDKERELLERRRQEEARQQAYREASQRERTRCKTRDIVLWPSKTPWTNERAVHRFKSVSIEFDEIKFCDTQPLTFESIPWPLLHPPLRVTFDNIEWGAVEEFFEAAKRVVDAAEYRSLVEKAHRRFHPDKWRGRGLLFTVLDEELKERLEDAGNVVAQAITPLWLASKAKK